MMPNNTTKNYHNTRIHLWAHVAQSVAIARQNYNSDQTTSWCRLISLEAGDPPNHIVYIVLFVTSLNVCPREAIRLNYSANRLACLMIDGWLSSGVRHQRDVEQTLFTLCPPEYQVFFFFFFFGTAMDILTKMCFLLKYVIQGYVHADKKCRW